MPTNPERLEPEFRKALTDLAYALKRWRVSNDLSQQMLHDLARMLGIKLYNSQIANFERVQLVPEPYWFLSLYRIMLAIEKGRMPKVQKGFSELTRDRLKAANPYLDINGEVATHETLYCQFVGTARINPIYLKVEKLTDEFCKKYGETLEKTFKKIAHERLLDNRAAWDELAKTKEWPKDKNYETVCKDILRGEHVLTKKEAIWCMNLGGGVCPCYRGLSQFANLKGSDPINISNLTKENNRLMSMVG